MSSPVQCLNSNTRLNYLSVFFITTFSEDTAHACATAKTSVFALPQRGFPHPWWRGDKHVSSIVIQILKKE